MATEDIFRDDWRCSTLSRVAQNVNNARKYGKYTDVTFVVGPDGDSCVIKAHRVVLGTVNAELEKLVSGLGDVPRVRIPDVSPRGFKNLIRFLYDIDVTFSDLSRVRETCRVAQKFQVNKLKLAAENYLNLVVKFEPILEMLQMAMEFEMSMLQEKCIDIISTKYQDVLKSEELVSASYEVLMTVLITRGDDCQYQALLAIGKWQKKHKADQIRLGYLLHCVNFETVKMTDFNNFIEENESLLSDVDIEAFRKYILSKEKCDAPNWYRYSEEALIEKDCIDAEKAEKEYIVKNFEQIMGLQKSKVDKALDEELHYIEKMITEAANVSIENHKASVNKTVREIVDRFSDIINEAVETAVEGIENDLKDLVGLEENASSKMGGKESNDSRTEMVSASEIEKLSKSEDCNTSESEIAPKCADSAEGCVAHKIEKLSKSEDCNTNESEIVPKCADSTEGCVVHENGKLL